MQDHEGGVEERADRCRTRDVTQQRDLTERVALLECVDVATVDGDGKLARGDDVKAVARVTLGHDGLALAHSAVLGRLGKSFDRQLGKRGEERHASKQIDIRGRYRRRLVDAAEGRDGRHDEHRQ